MIHTVKGFGIVSKAEIDVFLELSCFFDDPANVGILISGSSAFSKTSLSNCKFMVHILLNVTMDQLDLTDIYMTFYPRTMNFSFFSGAHITLSRIDHFLGHKSSLGRLKKIEIIPSIFSDHNAVRLDVNYRKIAGFRNGSS